MTRIDDASPENGRDGRPASTSGMPNAAEAAGAADTTGVSREVGGRKVGSDVAHASTAPEHTAQHAVYSWPTKHGGAIAQLEISADTRDDGSLQTWRYRAKVLGPAVLAGDTSPPQAAAHSPHHLPPYRYESVASEVIDPAQRIPATAHAFARESFIDEAAARADEDPVNFRLRHLASEGNEGPREVIRMVAQRAAWGMPSGADAQGVPKGWQRGRGFAFDGQTSKAASNAEADTWSAWIVDLDVNPVSGEIALRRVVAAQASGRPGEAAAVDGLPAEQIADAVRHALGATWRMSASPDEIGTSTDEHAVMRYVGETSETPSGAVMLPPADAERLAGAAAPAAAAIANALFDATGIRLRRPPFTPENLRATLRKPVDVVRPAPGAKKRGRLPQRWPRWLAGGAIAGIGGLASVMFFGAAEIAPIAAPDNTLWSMATLERGRQIALAGDCAVCHTAAKGATNAGGLALETPFGTVYSTNITPDPDAGIGRWSYAAFARAMREGISRDGSHLYPAFPYTAFAKMSEPDMLALYAYLMSQPAVANTPPKTELPFPLNRRRLVAGWNWLYHDTTEYRPDPSQSALWNRGRYLVDGAGHCGACHTPRNMLGAEQAKQYLGGGEVEGWRAPPLVASKESPVPWTEPALFDYLRTGFSHEHGVAAGPMAPVVAGLAALPETDVRAIAHYLASLSPTTEASKVAEIARQRTKGADVATTLGLESGRRTFEAACAVCHTDSGGVGHFGVRPLMGLNSSVSQATPDNLMHVLMNGIDQPATEALGYMPGFRDAFDDRQIAELAAFIRARYAPDQPPWPDLETSAAHARNVHSQ